MFLRKRIANKSETRRIKMRKKTVFSKALKIALVGFVLSVFMFGGQAKAVPVDLLALTSGGTVLTLADLIGYGDEGRLSPGE